MSGKLNLYALYFRIRMGIKQGTNEPSVEDVDYRGATASKENLNKLTFLLD